MLFLIFDVPGLFYLVFNTSSIQNFVLIPNIFSEKINTIYQF